MTCVHRGGTAVETTTKFVIVLGQCVLIVKDVPAHVCRQCGEAVFSSTVMKRLEQFAESVRSGGMNEVAIFHYPQNAA